MSYSDVMSMKTGEMVDLINCLAIYKGAAKEKRIYTFDQILMMR